MKIIKNALDNDRLELLALFEMTNSAYNLSVKLGLTNLSQTLSDAVVIVSNSATVEEYVADKDANNKNPIKH